MDTLKGLLGSIAGIVLVGLIGLAMGFYINAARAGVEEAFGWDGWWVLAVLIVMVILRVGIIVIVGFGAYAAFAAWDWAWWQVLITFFPFVALAIAGGLFGALQLVFERVMGKRQPKIER